MSHVTEMETEVNPKFIQEFISSLKDYFGEENVEVDLENPIEMKRWNGMSLHEKYADYGVAPKCNIVVRRAAQEKKLGHAAPVNDLGYRIHNGKIESYVDVSGFSKQAQGQLTDNYNARVTQKQLKKQGYTVKKVVENGVIKLKASKYM